MLPMTELPLSQDNVKRMHARIDEPRRQAIHGAVAVVLCWILTLSGCTVGPRYARPAVATPAAYKELTPSAAQELDGWKQAQPNDAAIRDKWWEVFNDEQLNSLEDQVNISNQTIAAAAANFMAARALVREARANYYPTVAFGPSAVNERLPNQAAFQSQVRSFSSYSLPFEASWEPDLWGRVRNTVRANVANAQATAADLENVRLAEQSQLAIVYYELRVQDALKVLFEGTVAAYQESLELTQLQFQAGIASEEAVAQAETQLEATQAENTNLGIARAQFEHAIALLVGQPAAEFGLPVAPLAAKPPAVPFGVPSELLERRPDIAAAERAMAQANARIGVATAAFYPNVTLSASAGVGTTSIAKLFTWPSRFWSLGPSLAQTVFDAGARRATVEQFQALYDQSAANYRQTVLTAFQQVEDNLVALRLLSQEIQQQDMAVASAQRNLQAANERYRAGIDPYLNVISAQTILLSNQQTAVNLRGQQMTSGVRLIQALGGGWNASQLPSSHDVSVKTSQAAAPTTPSP